MSSFFTGKKILVTGATGSIGSEIVRQVLLQNPSVVRLYSRDEHKQFMMEQELRGSEKVRYLIGDVRDLSRLSSAMEDIDYVFHTAAYKHVPLCEYNSFEAVKTNVIGTQNVIDAALQNNVERVVLISTDKAASPSNVMGATKLLAEKLMTSAMHSKGTRNILFSSVRFGNVVGSRGSVIPTFISQIENGEPVTITDPEMLRFFMSIPQAVQLTMDAMQQMMGGEVFILKMPIMKLGDLVDVLIEKYGNDKTEKKIIGLRAGEKMTEELMTEAESAYAEEKENMFIVHTLHNLPGEDFLEFKPHNDIKGWDSSSSMLLTKEQIAKMV
ncbi:hypothetical protein COU75_03840 [Candidatus Peregrinibacteria bacterium CG10_big_fil_rev_8_21_14_0_10_42_8]|nr:MAG: hypothetical protein COU75_03840 [Candidatus Peregrinibacteria bacterium CG10_big_fil_rev_8_21_14_0_10_42_8]